MKFPISRLVLMLLALLVANGAYADVVTFSGTGNGPYLGDFRDGTVIINVSGTTVATSVGTVAPNPNSSLFAFDADSILSATDAGDTGVVVDFSFTDETFNVGDSLFITSIGTENSILLEALIGGSPLDVDWNLDEVLGPPPAFNDDGSGVNATIVGGPSAPAGLLLSPSVSGIDQLRVSWTGNGSGNQGLQFGLVAIPEPASGGLLLLMGVGALASIRRRRRN